MEGADGREETQRRKQRDGRRAVLTGVLEGVDLHVQQRKWLSETVCHWGLLLLEDLSLIPLFSSPADAPCSTLFLPKANNNMYIKKKWWKMKNAKISPKNSTNVEWIKKTSKIQKIARNRGESYLKTSRSGTHKNRKKSGWQTKQQPSWIFLCYSY